MYVFIDPALLFLEIFPKDVISEVHQGMDLKLLLGASSMGIKSLKKPE